MSIEALRSRLKYIILSNAISRADMDEIVLISESARSKLPDRFINVLHQADVTFGSSTKDSRKDLMDRLERILEVAADFPPESAAKADSELIPMFVLNEPDRARVLELCTAMRKIVHAANQFDQPHKVRLLNRIAAIESEVHKQKGMFDVVRSGISDVGETLGKFGTDIKPLTDRMAEVVGIVRKSTRAYDQLPAPEEVKQLPPPDAE